MTTLQVNFLSAESTEKNDVPICITPDKMKRGKKKLPEMSI